jgi:hypothetical protein
MINATKPLHSKRRYQRVVSLVILLILLALFPRGAWAQDYSFSLDKETVHVYWNADGTISIDYTLVFSNDPGASPIDFVDLGLPNNNYEIENISAEIDGQPITDITDSPYVTYGVALGLGSNAIPPGETGTVHAFVDQIRNPYYIDYEDDNYASFNFSPTWFDSQFVHGQSEVTVTFHLPPGVKPAEPRWHTAPYDFPEQPETGFDEEERITYTWHNPNANGHTQYVFGASVPRQYVLSTFRLPSETLAVQLNADGSVDVENTFTFVNESTQASLSNLAIDLPYGSYEITNLRAEIDGSPVQDVSASYSDVNITLGPAAIQPGASGSIHLAYTLVGETFTSSWWDEEYKYATFDFGPTSFNASWMTGLTDLTVVFHLPANVARQEIHWEQPTSFSAAPLEAQDSQGRVTLTWHHAEASPKETYSFVVHMPREYIAAEAIYEYPKPGLLARMGIDEGLFYGCLFTCGFLAFIVGIIALSMRAQRRRKMKYLPPKIRIEGHGIKRGLSAVEAAVLMELPPDRILTMILFGLLKKEAANVVSRDPLKLEINAAPDRELRYYEEDFLEAFSQDNAKDRRKKLQNLLVKLIRNVGKRMKGFSHKETVAYYQKIMRKAWSQIEAADTPEVRSQLYDEHMGWTMLDKDFDQRTQEVFRTGPVFVPTWWGRYDPGWSRTSGRVPRARPTASTGTGGRPSISKPQLPGGEFAASVVTGMQGFASDVVGNITSFTNRITQRTNPIPKPSSSGRSWSSGGGGGCACACACAGCACACAGGGR